MIGGFGLTHVIAESNSTTGGGADRSAPVAVVASKSDESSGLLGGGGTNANVVLNSDNTGDSTGSENKVQNTGYETPSVNVNNMSSYPQTGDAHDTGLIITGFSILIGLFAFYGYKLRKSLVVLHVSKVSK